MRWPEKTLVLISQEALIQGRPPRITHIKAALDDVGITGIEADAVREAIDNYNALYHELIMEVSQVFPGESRHDTARRYIREAATPCAGCRGETDKHTCDVACAAEPN